MRVRLLKYVPPSGSVGYGLCGDQTSRRPAGFNRSKTTREQLDAIMPQTTVTGPQRVNTANGEETGHGSYCLLSLVQR